jgi:hypothetical protein
MFGKNLGKFRVNLDLVLSIYSLRFSFSLDAKVLEIDFFRKVGQICRTFKWPCQWPMPSNLLDICISQWTTLKRWKYLEFTIRYVRYCIPWKPRSSFSCSSHCQLLCHRQCYGDLLHQFRISISISYFLISGSIWYDQL